MKNQLQNLLLGALLLQTSSALALDYAVLHQFGLGGTGLSPVAPVISGPDGTLYGTASKGQGESGGTVFKIQPDGTGFAVLKYFTNSVDPEGATPMGRLVLSGNTLYGTASAGGTNNDGTVFRVNTDGSSFACLHHFTGSDGATPLAGLALSGGVLYGTTEYGGSNNVGGVFRLNTDGTGFTNLWQFNQTDGANPVAGLLLVGDTLYGATEYGNGQTSAGTLFKINTDGSGFTNFFVFQPAGGANPVGGLIISGNTLYGTALKGGDGYGTAFKVNTDGSGFSPLHTFQYDNLYPPEGGNPASELILSGNALYGITESGGAVYQGTVFRVNTDGSGFANLYEFPYTNGVSFGPPSGLALINSTLYLTSGGTICTLNTNGGGFHAFTNIFRITDGGNPIAGLTVSGGTLFGTTSMSDTVAGNGTVFRMNTDGTDYTNIYSFSGQDGGNPQASVIVDGNTLYGTTSFGGTNYGGVVFRMNSDGTGFTDLHTFSGPDGVAPKGELLLAGNTLYGTTSLGGAHNNGTVFRVNVDGSGFTNLYDFSALVSGTNSDGAIPSGGLVLSGGTLYGTAFVGGADGFGTVFKLGTNGANFAVIHEFNYPAYPISTLVLSGSTLYGTASGEGYQGVNSGYGAVFKLNTDGTGFTNLVTGGFYSLDAGLIVSGHTLYGAEARFGTGSAGRVFQVNTDGSGFTNLCVFTNLSGPANPYGKLVLVGNTLYGTTEVGGTMNEGTVFALPLSAASPQLAIALSGAKVILTWPADAAGFALQSATNLVLPITWNNVLPGPVIINGQNTVTNPISARKMFYRLAQ